MALIAKLQRDLRAAFCRIAPKSALPFSFMIPFCPIAERAKPVRARLAIGPLAQEDGWLILPVEPIPNESSTIEGSQANTAPESLPVFPGYPSLPKTSAFILGYAGDAAGRVSEGIRSEAFAVSARYRASVTVSVNREGGAYAVTYTVGPATWEK
jgi:hypothetical protein